MRGRNSRAFTLVELIVVIAVLAILAAAGVGTAVGYMKRSKFSKNQENAITIYQITQTALSQKEKNGSIEAWVEQLMTKGTVRPYISGNPSTNVAEETRFLDKQAFNTASKGINASYHIRYSLTYVSSKKDDEQSALLSELIRPYLYDASILAGTVTVEFDVVKGYDTDLAEHYSANCFSVFVDADNSEGWTELPNRDIGYRSGTSLVGYTDIGQGSLTDLVFLRITDTLNISFFELRYSKVKKTLNITWSASAGGSCILGRGKAIQYVITLKDDSDNTICELVLREDQLLENSTSAINFIEPLASAQGTQVLIEGTSYIAKVNEELGRTIDENLAPHTYYSTSISTADNPTLRANAQAHVRINQGEYTDRPVTLPVTIAYITNDIDNSSQHLPLAPYMTYTISLTNNGDPEAEKVLTALRSNTAIRAEIIAKPITTGEGYNDSGAVFYPADGEPALQILGI